MYKRIFKLPSNFKSSFFLFGPRGTGKTTWLKNNFSNSIYLDLLESELNRKLSAKPESLENYIPKNYSNWVILDEVQKIPELLNEVHRLIETYKYNFILSGSSARSLRKKGVNLLAGRAITYYFHPLINQELKKDFSLTYSLKYGQLPMAYQSKLPEKFLNSYIQTYLQEEVQQEGLTRNLGNFSRFLEVASFSQGQILNVSQVAKDSQIERKTVENYFRILEDLLIAYRIPIFSKKAKRKLVKHEKFYYFDVGVFKTLRPTGPLDIEEEINGPALETLFLQELKAINDYRGLNYSLYYWRSVSGLEVDFILYGEKGLIAIEIKSKTNINSHDLRGLKTFSQDYPTAKCFLFCAKKRREYHGNINLIPIEEALANLENILTN